MSFYFLISQKEEVITGFRGTRVPVTVLQFNRHSYALEEKSIPLHAKLIEKSRLDPGNIQSDVFVLELSDRPGMSESRRLVRTDGRDWLQLVILSKVTRLIHVMLGDLYGGINPWKLSKSMRLLGSLVYLNGLIAGYVEALEVRNPALQAEKRRIAKTVEHFVPHFQRQQQRLNSYEVLIAFVFLLIGLIFGSGTTLLAMLLGS